MVFSEVLASNRRVSAERHLGEVLRTVNCFYSISGNTSSKSVSKMTFLGYAIVRQAISAWSDRLCSVMGRKIPGGPEILITLGKFSHPPRLPPTPSRRYDNGGRRIWQRLSSNLVHRLIHSVKNVTMGINFSKWPAGLVHDEFGLFLGECVVDWENWGTLRRFSAIIFREF